MLLTVTVLVVAAQTAKLEPTQVGFSSNPSWKDVEQAMDVKSELKPDGAITFSIPMSLKVTLDDITLNPASDLTHDFDFMRAGNKTMMVGEIGLTETEVKNVTSMVLQSGLQVTAIHNHLLRTSPSIIWMHIYGYGDPADMAKKIRSITDYVNGKPPDKSEESFQSKGINTLPNSIRLLGQRALPKEGLWF
jgi:hypothetical protein